MNIRDKEVVDKLDRLLSTNKIAKIIYDNHGPFEKLQEHHQEMYLKEMSIPAVDVTYTVTGPM